MSAIFADAHRRACRWLLILVGLNVVTWIALGSSVLVWWPEMLAVFHLGRMAAVDDLTREQRDVIADPGT